MKTSPSIENRPGIEADKTVKTEFQETNLHRVACASVAETSHHTKDRWGHCFGGVLRRLDTHSSKTSCNVDSVSTVSPTDRKIRNREGDNSSYTGVAQFLVHAAHANLSTLHIGFQG
jgi:hypothetical protein